MKKLLCCMLVVVLLLGGCGKDGKDAELIVLDFIVMSNQWDEYEFKDDRYFYYFWKSPEIHVPQLTGKVFDEGAVLCYMLQNLIEGGRPQVVQKPLPYTINGFYDDNGYDVPYSENYSFQIRPGYITFIVKYSDFGELRPPRGDFRVVILR